MYVKKRIAILKDDYLFSIEKHLICILFVVIAMYKFYLQSDRKKKSRSSQFYWDVLFVKYAKTKYKIIKETYIDICVFLNLTEILHPFLNALVETL